VQRLARSGSFAVDLASGVVDASPPLFELLGLVPRAGQHFGASPLSWQRRIGSRCCGP
jgi:hypothetical protein